MVLSDAQEAGETMVLGGLVLIGAFLPTSGGCTDVCLNANLSHSRMSTLNHQLAPGLHSAGIYGAFDKTCLHTALWSSRSNFKYVPFHAHKSL